MINQSFIQKQCDGKVIKSILEFSTDKGFEHFGELFVLFSPWATNGPAISRTGKGSPTMINRIKVFSDPTPDPDLQRFGNYVVDDAIRKNDLENLEKKLRKILSKITIMILKINVLILRFSIIHMEKIIL